MEGSLENFAANKDKSLENPVNDLPEFLHGESYLNALKDSLAGQLNPKRSLFRELERRQNTEIIEKAKTILDTFFQQALNHCAIYETPDGTKFPYTVIRVSELAKVLLRPDLARLQKPEPVTGLHGRKQTFIFGSFPTLKNGHPFTFIEYAMHGAVQALPAALQALRDGKQPDSQEFIVFGSPTQETWGSMSSQFAQQARQKPFDTFGEMYAEAIQKLLFSHQRTDESSHNVEFIGASMGASLAEKSAVKLREQLQAAGISPLPKLSVHMDAPVGASAIKNGTSYASETELGLLLGLDGLRNPSLASTKAMIGEGIFLRKIKLYLLRHSGMPVVGQEFERTEKESVIHSVIDELRQGVPIDPNLPVEITEGTSDLLLAELALRRSIREDVARLLGNPLPPRKQYSSNVIVSKYEGGHVGMFDPMNPEKVQALLQAAQALGQKN